MTGEIGVAPSFCFGIVSTDVVKDGGVLDIHAGSSGVLAGVSAAGGASAFAARFNAFLLALFSAACLALSSIERTISGLVRWKHPPVSVASVGGWGGSRETRSLVRAAAVVSGGRT